MTLSWFCLGPGMGVCLVQFQNLPAIKFLLFNPWPWWSFFTFTQNFFMALDQDFVILWLGITWSLAVEEQFYLFLPLIIRFVPNRLLPYLLIGGCVGAVLLRRELSGFEGFVLMPARVDSLFLGVFVAYLTREPRYLRAIRRQKVLLPGVFVGVLIAGLFVFHPSYLEAYNKAWLAILWATLLLCVIAGSPLVVRLLRVQALVRLGIISYGVYLFHEPIYGLVYGFLLHDFVEPMYGMVNVLMALISLVITLTVSSLLYRWVEAPFIRLGHGLTTSKPTARVIQPSFGEPVLMSHIQEQTSSLDVSRDPTKG